MPMNNQKLRDYLIGHVLHRVQSPAQYIGGELNVICKDHREVRGTLCLAFPDAYTIGMSHHGLQVLYALMNQRDDWACERVFTPWIDMEAELRREKIPLYSLETFTPLCDFDVLGFTLQTELCVTNVLTMLDLGQIPLAATDRTMADPLVIAGGPCAQNPEPMTKFIDLFVTGDGEPSLPQICDRWIAWKEKAKANGSYLSGEAGRQQREDALAAIAAELPFCYVPRLYEVSKNADGRSGKRVPMRSGIPATIQPSILTDFAASPIPVRPVVPHVECVHDRIAIEIMRGCPGRCRFCQSTVIRRPLRFRSVDTIVEAALESYRNTGYSEISILSLSTSDYPHFEELVHRLHEVFSPLGVNLSVPSLRVNDQLRTIAHLIGNRKRSALTLAPEVALDDMREQIGKPIKNDDLYEGCRQAFRNNYQRVKLYFMCGLPGEREIDLNGIIDLSETISRIGKEEVGRPANVTASVSNFVPKAHTPYQWNAMQTREYFYEAHTYLRKRCRVRSVQVKCHKVESSLLEGVLCRSDYQMGEAIELAWRRGARFDNWTEQSNTQRWWQAIADTNVDISAALHQPYQVDESLPWDHIDIRQGRSFLEKEYQQSQAQLKAMS